MPAPLPPHDPHSGCGCVALDNDDCFSVRGRGEADARTGAVLLSRCIRVGPPRAFGAISFLFSLPPAPKVDPIESASLLTELLADADGLRAGGGGK